MDVVNLIAPRVREPGSDPLACTRRQSAVQAAAPGRRSGNAVAVWICALLLALTGALSGAALAKEEASRALTRQLELNRQRYGIAGQALLVMHDGRVVFRGVNGQADLQTRERLDLDAVFAGYSLSKLFVSTLVLQLVEQGKVDLERPASAYLQGLPARWQAITVRDFLDHSSGVPEYFDNRQGEMADPASLRFPAEVQAVFAALADEPLQFAPGSDTRYTQTNYLVLAALLAAHYGKPYAQVAEERIVRRLGLRHTWLGPAALPAQGVVTNYIGRNGRLERDTDVAWPTYAYGHAALYLTLDDLARFLQAVSAGELVGKATLQQAWQPRRLSNGRRGWFAAGWEYGESSGYRQVGHDGGARDRIRILFEDSLDGEVYIVVYLTNGSARNVWTRTLVDSALAAVAPQRFRREALSERLIAYALQTAAPREVRAQARAIRAAAGLGDAELERAVNDTGYAIRENFGVDAALRVFELNTALFPQSANVWDSLAEAYTAKGHTEKAQTLHEKSRALSTRASEREATGR
ncbi:serine hydrolase domain-containing protein [Tahibacter sp. UC22_41]|uniref:serine hydrolase domain-containing protein n=1 Tax=Tahibacter sp. UC22_41 TaxID=3350178 RepID=UPI0036D84298